MYDFDETTNCHTLSGNNFYLKMEIIKLKFIFMLVRAQDILQFFLKMNSITEAVQKLKTIMTFQ